VFVWTRNHAILLLRSWLLIRRIQLLLILLLLLLDPLQLLQELLRSLHAVLFLLGTVGRLRLLGLPLEAGPPRHLARGGCLTVLLDVVVLVRN